MHIFAISYFMPPACTPQAFQIGRLLLNTPLNFTILNSVLQQGALSEQRSHLPRKSHLIRVPDLSRHRSGTFFNILRRIIPLYGTVPDPYLNWSKRAIDAALSFCYDSSPDLIISFGEPMSDHLVGLALKRRLGVPWIAHFSDPWCDNPFRSLQPLSYLPNRLLELATIREADGLIFTSEETRALVMSKYSAAWNHKTYILPHSFPAKYPCDEPPSTPNSKIIARSLGSFYGHRTPFPLINSLHRLLNSDSSIFQDVTFELIGPISAWMRYHPLISKLPPGLLVFRDPVSYEESLRLMQESDLLIVVDAPAKNSVFLPSKLIDYLGSGTPIFGITPQGPSYKLITALGGYAAFPDDPFDVDSALASALAQCRTIFSASKSPWGNSVLRDSYSVQSISRRFQGIINAVMRD
jgi:hypothetical protein